MCMGNVSVLKDFKVKIVDIEHVQIIVIIMDIAMMECVNVIRYILLFFVSIMLESFVTLLLVIKNVIIMESVKKMELVSVILAGVGLHAKRKYVHHSMEKIVTDMGNVPDTHVCVKKTGLENSVIHKFVKQIVMKSIYLNIIFKEVYVIKENVIAILVGQVNSVIYLHAPKIAMVYLNYIF